MGSANAYNFANDARNPLNNQFNGGFVNQQGVQGINQQLSGGYQGAGFSNQMGGGFQNQGLMDSLMSGMNGPSSTGQMYQNIVGGSGNTYIDPMVDAMRQGYTDNLQRNLLPSLKSGAVDAGQTGSSRQGIAEGLALGESNRDAAMQEAMMRGNAYDTDLNWKMQIAQQADQGRSTARQQTMDYLGMQNQNQQGAISQFNNQLGSGVQNMGGLNSQMNTNQQGGLSFAPQYQNLYTTALNPQLAGQQGNQNVLQSLANLIGNPQVLSQGRQNSSSKGGGTEGHIW
jgi:hypothetical protein